MHEGAASRLDAVCGVRARGHSVMIDPLMLLSPVPGDIATGVGIAFTTAVSAIGGVLWKRLIVVTDRGRDDAILMVNVQRDQTEVIRELTRLLSVKAS